MRYTLSSSLNSKMTNLVEISSIKYHGGHQKKYSHTSVACKCTMTFGIYIPPAIEGTSTKAPVLYYLGGLTSDVEKNVTLVNYQQYAAKHNLVVVTPDTSPRNTGLPGEKDDNLFRLIGHGAGFYLDAMTPGWKDHYNMFTYVTQELIQVVESNFAFVLPGRRGIMGQSMGGHGTLLCALKRPNLYQSVSCFFPVANVTASVFGGGYETYLGTDKEVHKQWDAYEVMKSYDGPSLDIMVHQGTSDGIWDELKVWQLIKATHGKDNVNLDLKLHGGYDHADAYLNTVMELVITYHANILHK